MATYALWNSADKDATITLTGSSLIATQAGATYGGVRSNISKAAGKIYVEFAINANTGECYVGVAKSGASLTNYLGSDASGWGYWNAGTIYNNAGVLLSPATYAPGDVIGLAFDATAGKLWFHKNGTYLNSGDPAAGTGHVNPSNLFAGQTMFAMFVGKNGSAVTAKFGATAFTYTVPTGFNPGLYTPATLTLTADAMAFALSLVNVAFAHGHVLVAQTIAYVLTLNVATLIRVRVTTPLLRTTKFVLQKLRVTPPTLTE